MTFQILISKAVAEIPLFLVGTRLGHCKHFHWNEQGYNGQGKIGKVQGMVE